MFNIARKKLTGWYLIILMSVSIAFSIVIYRGMSLEVDRFAHLQQARLERQFGGIVEIDEREIREMKRHIATVLVGINGIIFFVMGGLSYFLADKTLRPIGEMVEEQNRFISDASHELKTPLTAMKSSLEVYLRDPKLTLSEAKQVLSDNITEVNRLASLSKSLLTLSENQTKIKNAIFTSVDINVLISAVITQLYNLAHIKKISITTSATGEHIINGNEEKLRELLVILLDNAIKYSNEKAIISIAITPKQKGIEIAVCDTGIGIASQDIPHVFDRFYRADSARGREGQGGYGLGLSIVKKIVELHNGTINIESSLKKGTSVLVWLPV